MVVQRREWRGKHSVLKRAAGGAGYVLGARVALELEVSGTAGLEATRVAFSLAWLATLAAESYSD